MSALPLETNLVRIFLEDVPLIDLRAPVEFNEGAFPNAVSLPLMTDKERAQVGTCYKQQGQAAAIGVDGGAGIEVQDLVQLGVGAADEQEDEQDAAAGQGHVGSAGRGSPLAGDKRKNRGKLG